MFINKNAIERLDFFGRDGLIEGLISLYFNNSEKMISEIKESVQHLDLESIRKRAHAWRSSNLNVGADSLAQMLQELEIACIGPKSIQSLQDNFQHKLDKIENEYLNAKSELIEIMRQRH